MVLQYKGDVSRLTSDVVRQSTLSSKGGMVFLIVTSLHALNRTAAFLFLNVS